jgi:TBC1 domain family protein 5
MKKILQLIHKKETSNEENTSKNYINSSFEKFIQHLKNPKNTIKDIISKIKYCELKSQYRPVAWLIFLNILPYNHPENWKQIIDDNRTEYLTLKNSYITKEINNFIEIEEEKGNLKYEEAKEKLSNKDFEIISLIKIDINRTYPEMDFFKNKEIKNILITVLYIYSKKFPLIGYNQGMNEICAILLYNFYQKYKLNDSFIKGEETFLYYMIHSNNEFIECDIYHIFKNLMEKDLKIFYLYNQEKYKNSFLSQKTIEEKLKLTSEEIMNCNDSDLKKRMYKLFFIDLVEIDKGLVKYLHQGEVDPDLFLLRWYICLFSREFKFENVIYLWDIIFMYEFIEFHYIGNKGFLKGQHLNFIECIVISIFKCLKPKFAKVEEKSEYLDILLHHVNDLDIKLILQKAIKVSNTLYGKQIP